MGFPYQCTRHVPTQNQRATTPWRWLVGGAVFFLMVGASVTGTVVLSARAREAASIRESFESSSKDRAHAMMEGVVELVEGALPARVHLRVGATLLRGGAVREPSCPSAGSVVGFFFFSFL